jgi:DNA end-binding protein Ku
MLWPEEVRESEFAVPGSDVTVKDQERAMAESYIATLEAEFDPTRYHSEYREALEELVEAKASGLEPAQVQEEADDSGEVVDLVAALRASVDAAKKRRGEQVDDGTGDTASAEPAKKTAAKGPGKKGPARKSTAKTAKKTTKKAASSTKKTAPKKSTAKTAAKKAEAGKRKSA